MGEQIITGVITGVTLAILLGSYVLLRDVSKRINECFRSWDRAQSDYRIAVERAEHEHQENLRAIDGHFVARGIYDSGLRLAARSKAQKKHELRGEELFRELSRRIDDGTRELRRIDAAWLVLRHKQYRTGRGLHIDVWKALFGKRASFEHDILEPVLSEAKGNESVGESG